MDLFSDSDNYSYSNGSDEQDEMETFYGGLACSILSSLEESIGKIDDFLSFERGFVHGDVVVPATDPCGQMGKVININIYVDLENRHGKIIKEVNFRKIQMIGSHQFKVSNRDCIYTERLKFCEVNDKLILNKVLMLGSSSQTIIGRPILPDAAVHAVVEEHALDAKVIIFKKKRRKNYRRTKGHRQELTKLRITDIQGIEKPEITASGENEKKATSKKPEKVAIPAYKKPEKVAVPA